jgi:transcriptional regulator with PAS, ATPase and Fis domain
MSAQNTASLKKELIHRHRRLKEHDWTGNIRELRNVVEGSSFFQAKYYVEDVSAYVLPKK